LVDVTVLYNEDVAIVPAGEYHMFKSRRDTKALEIYWSELSLNDIEREVVGGIIEKDVPLMDNFGKVFNLDNLQEEN